MFPAASTDEQNCCILDQLQLLEGFQWHCNCLDVKLPEHKSQYPDLSFLAEFHLAISIDQNKGKQEIRVKNKLWDAIEEHLYFSLLFAWKPQLLCYSLCKIPSPYWSDGYSSRS